MIITLACLIIVLVGAVVLNKVIDSFDHDSYENLFENLERIAKDFKEKETKTND